MNDGDRRVNARMTMVARDMVVRLFPQPLDGVVVGRVRRQEVQRDTTARDREVTLNAHRLGNDVVVEHQARLEHFAVAARLHEGGRVLATGDAADGATGVRIQCTEDVACDVPPGRENHQLRDRRHVRGAHLPVQVQIGLVLAGNLPLRRHRRHQVLSLVDHFPPLPARRAAQPGTLPFQAVSAPAQRPQNVVLGKFDAGVVRKLQRQELQRSGAALPTVILRYLVQVFEQPLLGARREPARLALAALVADRSHAQLFVAVHRTTNLGAHASDHAGDFGHAHTLVQQQYEARSSHLQNTSTLASYANELPPLDARQVDVYPHVLKSLPDVGYSCNKFF